MYMYVCVCMYVYLCVRALSMKYQEMSPYLLHIIPFEL